MSSAPPLTPEQRRFLRGELIVNGVVSAVISAAFVWLMFGGQTRIPLWGINGLAFDIVPTTVMLTLMMTIGLTLFTRARVGKGVAPRLDGISRLPRNVVLRALVLVLGALVLVPVTVGLLALLGPETWSFASVMALKIGYGVLLALAITPAIVLAAIRDGNARVTR